MKTIVAIISLSLCITVCAQESISLESQADALIQAYDNNDYEAFAKAFPSSYTNFLDLFGYDIDGKSENILYHKSWSFITFFFSDSRVLEGTNLDKILGISYGFKWDADAPSLFIGHTIDLSLKHPQEIIGYLDTRTDSDKISYFKLCLACLLPDHPDYLKERFYPLLHLYETYSFRYAELIRAAYVKAAVDAARVESSLPEVAQTGRDLKIMTDSLTEAYNNKNYDAFYNAFPSTYDEFVAVFGFDPKNREHNLYSKHEKYIKYLFSSESVMNEKNLEKLLHLSKDFQWDFEAAASFVEAFRIFVDAHLQGISDFLQNRTNEEKISFFKMYFTTLVPYDESHIVIFNCINEKMHKLARNSNNYWMVMGFVEAYKLSEEKLAAYQ